MVTKVLNIDVRDGELDELNKDLLKVRGNMDNVDGSSQKAAKSLEEVGKNGGLISTLDAFTGGLATRIRDAAEATKVFNFSLKSTRTALIATGIGAFVVALGAIAAYWEEIEEFITGANAQLQAQISASQNLQKQLDVELELLNLKQELLEAEGESADHIVEKKREYIQLLLTENENEIALLEIQAKRIQNQITEITLWERLVAAVKGDTAGISLIGGTAEEAERMTKTMDQLNAARKQQLQLQIELAKINAPGESQGRRGPDQEQLPLPTTGVTLTELETLGQLEFDVLKLQQTARTRLEEEQANYRKWVAEQEAKAKMESYMLAANGFQAAAQLIGQETAAGKAFSVASTLISTYLSAQRAYESQISIPTPDAPFRAAAAAAVAVTSGLANVKQILSTKVPGFEGSYGAVGASASTPPAFNVVGTSAQNQLNQALLERNSEPIPAFVVEGEVTTAEQLRRNKVSASSLG